MEKFKPYAFLFLAALIYTQGFPNHLGIIFPLGPIIATAILFHFLIKASGLKKRLWLYLFYNTVINIHSFSWITKTLQEFGQLPFMVAAIANSLYALVFNPHIWVLIFLYTWLEKKYEIEPKKVFYSGFSSVYFALVLTLIEFYLPQQFPVLIGQPWIIFGNYLGMAAVTGMVGFSFFSYLVVAEILNFKNHKKVSIVNIIAVFGFVGANFYFSHQKEAKISEIAKDSKKTYQVRLVQANISNFLKMDSEKGEFHSVNSVLERYENLSLEKSERKLDLVVWPETAYPYPLYTSPANIMATQVPTIFTKIAYEMNSAVLFGGYDHFKNSDDGSYYKTEYNAALFVNTLGQLEKVYHKHILIPFGETLPFGPLNKMISQYVPEVAFFREGTAKPLFETENGLRFIATICYEKLRPEFLREYLNSNKKLPHVMINLTNDSWYGDTLEPELHLFLARWRSAEFAIPTLRSTNTGVSVFIDRYGREKKRLGYNKTGNLDVTLDTKDLAQLEPSFYQKNGIRTLLVLIFGLFIFQGILLKYRHVKTSHKS